MTGEDTYKDERYPFVLFTLEARQDDIEVRGNALASGDEAEDKAAEDEILDRLDRGDIWAWCSVKVTAKTSYGGQTFEGTDYLGACNYADEAEFVQPDGYFDDMKAEAYADLRRNMEEAVRRGTLARKALQQV